MLSHAAQGYRKSHYVQILCFHVARRPNSRTVLGMHDDEYTVIEGVIRANGERIEGRESPITERPTN